jgi:hypothetical protein
LALTTLIDHADVVHPGIAVLTAAIAAEFTRLANVTLLTDIALLADVAGRATVRARLLALDPAFGAASLLATAIAALDALLAATTAAHFTLRTTATAGLLRATAAAAAAAFDLGWTTAAVATAVTAALSGLRQDGGGKGQRRGTDHEDAVFHEPWLLSETNNGRLRPTVPGPT